MQDNLSRSVATVCDQCEAVFEPRITHGPNTERFCSSDCRQAWHRANKADALAVVGTRRSMKELVDGTLRVQVDIDPQYRARFLSQFSEIGIAVGLIQLSLDATTGKAKPQAPQKPFGQQAKALRLSGFFRIPEVWKALGTDEEYREWVRRQPSAWSGEFSEHVNGEGHSIAAHVRRAGESGIGHKAEYACIPLTDAEHQRQHQQGESAFDAVGTTGKEWFDRMRIKYVEMWAWDRLRQALQVESMADADPKWVRQFAELHEIEQYLPREYREA